MPRHTGQDPIAEFLAKRIGEGRMPGAAWWIGRRNAPMSRGATGHITQLPPRPRATPDTIYDLASLTKGLATAPLLVLLEQSGLLDLTAPAQAYLPELGDTFCGAATLLDLASHTSGLAAWLPLYLDCSTEAQFLQRIGAEAREVPPGATLYSDLGYIVLGHVLERVTGVRLDRLFLDYVAAPLGLRRTRFGVADNVDAEQVAPTEQGNAYECAMAGERGDGHRWRKALLHGEVHDGNAHGLGGIAGHAGLFGTAEEVARVALELLRPEKLSLGEKARKRLLEPVSGSEGRSVGLTMARFAAAARGLLPDDAPGHTGFTGTSFWVDPTTESAFVLLSNRVHPRVPPRSFRVVRRGFHRLAAALFRTGASADGSA